MLDIYECCFFMLDKLKGRKSKVVEDFFKRGIRKWRKWILDYVGKFKLSLFKELVLGNN